MDARDPEKSRTVTIVIPGLSAGGTERIVSLISEHWAKRGWRVSILTFEAPGTAAYYPINPAITVQQLGSAASQPSKLGTVRAATHRALALRRAFRKSLPDVIVSFLTRTNVLTLLSTRGLPVPVVVSERNNPALQPFGAPWHWLRALTYPRAFGLVTMTKGALEYFPKKMRRREWVIPNPVELPQAWQERRGNHTLVAVGRLVPQKGFDLLLQAFARAAAAAPEWSLTIWGEGPDRAKLERQRDELGLNGRVHFPGVTERPGIWIETADAFVLSSRYEGWGIVLLEAMAAGLPVVSFDCEWGPREMINDGVDGLLVPAEDVASLSGALVKIMKDDTLRRQLGTTAAEAVKRYSRERVMAEWDNVVRDALQTKHKLPS
ncbi:glycosyltransferase family 4 protein [Nordella sp. HKS 07]|uniref:glycosyltransferase family 4 protein n=1 Tax=Nordella sp. HKS 07 TaxID=2712222 RepID=UPI0013E15CB2|nr:glycosyltransferase family 4 protein [Nordella sp. HKS 07]QIG49931.1 glycosyltransferase family 4 protein [Nordella sp. HKS 07]